MLNSPHTTKRFRLRPFINDFQSQLHGKTLALALFTVFCRPECVARPAERAGQRQSNNKYNCTPWNYLPNSALPKILNFLALTPLKNEPARICFQNTSSHECIQIANIPLWALAIVSHFRGECEKNCERRLMRRFSVLFLLYTRAFAPICNICC